MVALVSQAHDSLKRTSVKIAETANKIASGDTSPATIIDLKMGENEFRLQAKSTKLFLDTEHHLLEILA